MSIRSLFIHEMIKSGLLELLLQLSYISRTGLELMAPLLLGW